MQELQLVACNNIAHEITALDKSESVVICSTG